MIYLGWFVALLLGRVMGWPFLVVSFLASGLYGNDAHENLAKWLVVMGVVTDVVVGSRFGLSSLLFLLMYVQMTYYKEKIDSSSSGSLMLLTLISLVEMVLFWGVDMSVGRYVLGVGLGWAFWAGRLLMQKRGFGKSVYLRK